MAATCQLEHTESGVKTWHYTVDAKELLAAPGTPYRMTGEVKRSGWATGSGAQNRPRVPTPTSEERLGDAIAQGLVKAGVVTPMSHGDAVSAGLPPENDRDGQPSADDLFDDDDPFGA